MINPVIGIVSYYSGNELRNEARKKTFRQISELFPNTPILIIAQEWPDNIELPFKQDCYIEHYPKLGILKARQTLIKTFLKTDFDYLIMMDDDIILYGDRESANVFLESLNENPDGYCFKEGGLPGKIIGGSLRLCAVSKFILSNVKLPSVDPEKGQGYEDVIWPNVIIAKYPEKRFRYPRYGVSTILVYSDEGNISTWVSGVVGYNNWDITVSEIERICKKDD